MERRKHGLILYESVNVINASGAESILFDKQWYDPGENLQYLKCYVKLWHKYRSNIKSMYILFSYMGINYLIKNASQWNAR